MPPPWQPPLRVQPIPDDRLLPGRTGGVRPVEQDREFDVSARDREIRTVTPAPLQAAGTRRKTTPERAEAHFDSLLGAVGTITGTLAVMSPAGGVGKSTMSLAIADTLARVNAGPVAIVDCDPEYNGLALLAPGGGRLHTLIEDEPDDPHEYATHLPSGAHLYAMPSEAGLQRYFSENPRALSLIAERLREIYPLVILDTGAGVQNPIGREMGASCDQALLVSRATAATSAGMLRCHDYLRTARGLTSPRGEPRATTVTTVINNIRAHQRTFMHILLEEYHGAGIVPLLVPSAEAIEYALEEGTFSPDQVPAAARVAIKRLAVTVASGFGVA